VRVCVVGSGGREHALALALARSAEVVVTPGNPGMAGTSPEGYAISVTDAPPEALDAGLVVVGPEQPLVEGLADRLRAAGRLVLGPGADGARLEGSKAFMKRLLSEAKVPTARYGVFEDAAEAKAFLRHLPGPWVVKTDGLAAGKGVLVTDSLAEAEADVEAKLSGAAFGEAGRTVVVEEGLAGTECSLLALCDGRRVVPLPLAQDAKRLEDGDQGPNTGGMGAYSPVPAVGDEVVDVVLDQAVEPVVAALRRRGIDYRGVLYAGLMVGSDGPKVLEYNVRFGDPEAQVVLPRVADDVTGLLAEAASGRLRSDPKAAPLAALCVVAAAPGYPGSPRTGEPIGGLEAAGEVPGVTVLHAGTALDAAGRLVSAGGRVLGVRAVADDLAGARRAAYQALERIDWPTMHFRRDIGEAAARATVAGATGAGATGATDAGAVGSAIAWRRR
jgi:phosphoribosylamine--glycine ligase